MLVFTFNIAMNNDDCLERKILYHNLLEAGETNAQHFKIIVSFVH